MVFNTLTDLFTHLSSLMTTNLSLFEALGNRLYASFTVIIVVWFGIQCALKGSVPWDRFATMMLTISFGFAMTQYYSAPIPGFGVSFYHLIIDEGTFLADALNQDMMDKLTQRFQTVYFGLETPGLSSIGNIVEVVRWAILISAVAVAQASVFVVVAFGYIASAVCVLLGPVFIPFFIVPKMEWLFWGWLRALLQYAFYPVVANAYVYVLGQMMINMVDRTGGDYSAGQMAALFFPLVLILLTFIWGVLKVPSLVNSLFTGKAGESSVPFF